MKVRGGFPLGIILILFLGMSSSFAQEYEDVIYLKNGEVRRGLIIEGAEGHKENTNAGNSSQCARWSRCAYVGNDY